MDAGGRPCPCRMSPSGGKLSMEDAQRITSGEYVFSGERSEDGKLTLVPKTGSLEQTVDKELSRNLSWDVDNLEGVIEIV